MQHPLPLLLLLLHVLATLPLPAWSQCIDSAVDIRLQPATQRPASFLSSPPSSSVLTVTRGRALPRVVVQILDGAGKVDATVNLFLKVRVTGSDPSVSLSSSWLNNEAVVYNGEAHFTGLTINNVGTSIATFYLNFTAVVDSNVDRAVIGKTVSSGPLRMQSSLVDVFEVAFLRSASYISDRTSTVRIVSGAVLPPTRVAIRDSAHNIYVRPAAQGASGNQTIAVDFASTPPAGVSVLGGLAVVVQGIATFRYLSVVAPAGATLPALRFTLVGTALSVTSGPVLSDRLTENARIDFEDESVSFIYSEGQELSAVSGVPFPLILVTLRNTLLQRSPDSTGLIITASIPTGGRSRLTGNVVGVVNGVARFDALTLEVEHADQRPYVITFTAGVQGALPLAGSTLVTGIILASSQRIPAYSIRFRQSTESFFTGERQDAQVVQGRLRLPVQVELLDSANEVDTNTSTVAVEAIQATSSGILTVKAAKTTVVGGRVSFPSLELSAQEADEVAVLLFRASGAGTRVDGAQLTSGRLNITAEVRNYDLQFQSSGASLFSAAGQTSFATVGIALPPIVVQVVTSAQVVDTQSNDIGITATADGGALLSGAFMRVSGGVAVFSDLTFVSETPGTYRVTFTAGSEGDTPAAGKTLVTAAVTVVGARTPDFRIRFRNTSYIAYNGHAMPITLRCCAMPNVSVELVDSAHSFAGDIASGNGGNASTAVPAGTVHPRLRAVVSLSGKSTFASTSGPLIVPFIDNVAVFENLRVESAFNPILSVCVESTLGEEDPDPANGACVASGNLLTRSSYEAVGAMRLLRDDEFNLPVDLQRQYSATTVTRGATLRGAVAILDSAGELPRGIDRNLPAITLAASSSIPLAGDTTATVNRSTGIVYFSNLRFSREFPLGITPTITFAVARVSTQTSTDVSLKPISTGLLSVARAGQASDGVEVVAELLTESTTFSFERWRAATCRRLNIETGRIGLLYAFAGTSAAATATVTEDTTRLQPEWRGTRVEMRFLPPLPTSRDTKPATAVADMFVNLERSCKIGELSLRRAYLSAEDRSCDWYIFDSQMNGVRACIQARGKRGYCSCHVPLFTAMGMRCLGLPRMTNLCLDVLINSNKANCKEPEIEKVCQLLRFPDVPRTELAGTAGFLFLFLPPLAYFYFRGIFHKIGRQEQARVTPLDAADGIDVL